MITVKGYKYYNDNKMPMFTKEFENVGQLMNHIQKEALGKTYVQFPAHNEDGSFNQDFAGAMCGCLRYSDENLSSGNPTVCIELITDSEGDIQFSSGSRTGNRGHISSIVKEALTNLKEWTESEYVFAE